MACCPAVYAASMFLASWPVTVEVVKNVRRSAYRKSGGI